MILNEGSQHLLLNGTGGLGLYQVMPERPDLSPTRVGRIWVSQDDLTPVPAAPYFISVSAADGFIDAQLGCIEAVDGYQLSWSESTVPDYEHVITDSSGMFHFGCTVTVYLFGRTVRSGRYSGWSTYGQIGQGQDEWVEEWEEDPLSGSDGTSYPNLHEEQGNDVKYLYFTGTCYVHPSYSGGLTKSVGFFETASGIFLSQYGGKYDCNIKMLLDGSMTKNRKVGVIFGARVEVFTDFANESFYSLYLTSSDGTSAVTATLAKCVAGVWTVIDSEEIVAYITSTANFHAIFLREGDIFTVIADGTTAATFTDSSIAASAERKYAGLLFEHVSADCHYIRDHLTIYSRSYGDDPAGVDPGDPLDSLWASRVLGDIPYIDATPDLAWLAGNTTTTKKYFTQTGTGAISAAPAWDTVDDIDVGFSDVTTGNVSISKHGYTAKAIAPPGRNDTNVFGIANGETVPSWKTLVGTTTPQDIIEDDVGDSGSSAEMARVDHKHGTPATWTPSAHNMLSTSHGDSTAGSCTRGDIIIGSGASPTWTRLAKGDAGKVLTMGADEPAWAAIPSGLTGSGTNGTVAKWSGTTSLADSILTESGTTVSAEGDITLHADTTGENRTLTIQGYDTGASVVRSFEQTVTSAGIYTATFKAQRTITIDNVLQNCSIGPLAGNLTMSGTRNTNIALLAGSSISSGSENCNIGYNAGVGTTSESDTVNIGAYAGYGAPAGSGSVAIGYKSAYNGGQNQGVYIGYNACVTGSGVRHVAIGYNASYSMTSGGYGYGVDIGFAAGSLSTTGLYNTRIGYQSGAAATTASSCVFLGNQSGAFETGSNKLIIDNSQRASEADGRIKALLYGIFDAANVNQYLYINGNLNPRIESTDTNAVRNVLTVSHNTTGTPANGLGTGVLLNCESSTTENTPLARVTAEWVDVTHATRKARGKLTAYDTAERECICWEASGSAPMIGFLGAAAAAQQAHVADCKADYTTGDLDTEAEIIAAVNAQAVVINGLLAALETYGFRATS